jgi:intein/homing endonuclease
LLPGVIEFFNTISEDDKIIILTARSSEYKEETEEFLIQNKIRFDYIIFDLPIGERILINDEKPSGLKTAYAYNLIRDKGL